MDVRVGERGNHGAAAQVDALGAAAGGRLDLALAAGGQHAPIADRQRMGARLGRVEGVDRAIVEDDG